jgi:uncharacterized protein
MRIAIFSDVHDALALLKKALAQIQGTDALICCGDLCSPFVIKTLGESYSQPIYCVLGNNDGDPYLISERAKAFAQIHLTPVFADFSLGGKRIAVIHYDSIARPLIASGWYDLVCFGHNHTYEAGRQGKTLYINPGELSGVLTGQATFVSLDTETGSVEKMSLS